MYGIGVGVPQRLPVPPAYDDLYVSPTEPMTQGAFIAGHPLAQGRADARPERARAAGSASTRSSSRAARSTTAPDDLPTVYAGNGAAADYAELDAKGKVVVVERSDEVTPEERAAAAVAAGAKALIVVNDGVGALNGVRRRVADPGRHRAPRRGPGCSSRWPRPARDADREAGSPYTDFVYDLTRDYPGQVPDRPLVYKPSQSDLARIDARYYNAGERPRAPGYRYDLTLHPVARLPRAGVAPGHPHRVGHARTRSGSESHAQNIYGALPWDMVSGDNTYARGSTTRLDWFAPAIRPGVQPTRSRCRTPAGRTS